MTEFSTAQPYAAVYLLFEKDEQFAFVRRKNTQWMDGYYGFPAGKVEKDESLLQAAVREGAEEVGITIAQTALQHLVTVHRKSEANNMFWVDVAFKVTEWDGELVNAEPDVHSELVWLSKHALPDNIVPNNRFIIDQILAGNTYAEYGWTDPTQI